MRSETRADSRLFRTLSRALLEGGYSVRFRAYGRSMFPAIADGETVELVPVANLCAGDVVLVTSDDRLVAHRIVAAKEDIIVTRGDSCFERDQPTTRHSTLGRITAVISPAGRRAPHTWRTRLVRLLSRLVA